MSYTFVAAATGAGTLTVPTVATGDDMWLWAAAPTAVALTTPPAGWSYFNNGGIAQTPQIAVALFRRTAASSDSGTTVTVTNAVQLLLVAYRPAGSPSSSTWRVTETNGSATASSLTGALTPSLGVGTQVALFVSTGGPITTNGNQRAAAGGSGIWVAACDTPMANPTPQPVGTGGTGVWQSEDNIFYTVSVSGNWSTGHIGDGGQW